jgi:hypothetical protein
MGSEEELIKACKGIVNRHIKNVADLKRTILDKCITSAVEILNSHNKKLSLQRITATGNYINSGYEVNYSGESINGAITIMDINYDLTGLKPNNDIVISVTCKAHSCVTRSLYKEEIPEADIMEFIKFATRGPTLNDRWKRIAGYYHGEI